MYLGAAFLLRQRESQSRPQRPAGSRCRGAGHDLPRVPLQGRAARRAAGRRAGPPAPSGAAGSHDTPRACASCRSGEAIGPAAVPPGARVGYRATVRWSAPGPRVQRGYQAQGVPDGLTSRWTIVHARGHAHAVSGLTLPGSADTREAPDSVTISTDLDGSGGLDAYLPRRADLRVMGGSGLRPLGVWRAAPASVPVAGGAGGSRAAGRAGSVVGVDMDQAKLELARQAARERGLGKCRVRGWRCQCLGCAGRVRPGVLPVLA